MLITESCWIVYVCFCLPVGGPIILKLVGISFGLLCIIQSAVNVYSWLQAGAYQPTPSTEMYYKPRLMA